MKNIPSDASLRDVAVRACQLHNDNVDAVGAMLKWAGQNPKHWEELWGDVEKAACDFMVSEVRHANSRSARGGADFEKGKETVSKVSSEARRVIVGRPGTALLEMLIGGKFLRDCTKDDLIEDADRNDLQIVGLSAKATFERRVAAKLKSGEVVGRRYREADLRRMYENARKASRLKDAS